MVMTTGDFEYDAIFRQRTGGTGPGEMIEEIPFPPVSFILWVIFLALMPILLTNLLVRRKFSFCNSTRVNNVVFRNLENYF